MTNVDIYFNLFIKCAYFFPVVIKNFVYSIENTVVFYKGEVFRNLVSGHPKQTL